MQNTECRMQNKNKRWRLSFILHSPYCILILALFTAAAPAPAPARLRRLTFANPSAAIDDSEAFAHNLLAAANWVEESMSVRIARAELLQDRIDRVVRSGHVPVPGGSSAGASTRRKGNG